MADYRDSRASLLAHTRELRARLGELERAQAEREVELRREGLVPRAERNTRLVRLWCATAVVTVVLVVVGIARWNTALGHAEKLDIEADRLADSVADRRGRVNSLEIRVGQKAATLEKLSPRRETVSPEVFAIPQIKPWLATMSWRDMSDEDSRMVLDDYEAAQQDGLHERIAPSIKRLNHRMSLEERVLERALK